MKVTFADKTNASQPTGATTEMPAEHYNEIKDVVNTNDDIATPLSVAYSTNVRADRIRFKSKFTMAGAVALTLDTTLAIPGLGETIPFVGDGNNITISGGTVVPSQNATISTESGVEIVITLHWSGSYWKVESERVNQATIDSISDLAEINTTIYSIINVKGYYTPNDGGGGLFNYDTAIDRSTANGGTIIDATETGIGNGCWVRQYSGAINVRWFGAKGDGLSSDTTAINNALAMTGTIEGNKGDIYLVGALSILSNTHLDLKLSTLERNILELPGHVDHYDSTASIFYLYQVTIKDMSIKNGFVNDKNTENTSVHRPFMTIVNSTTEDLLFENISFIDSRHALRVNPSRPEDLAERIVFKNCRFLSPYIPPEGSAPNELSINYSLFDINNAKYCIVDNCYAKNVSNLCIFNQSVIGYACDHNIVMNSTCIDSIDTSIYFYGFNNSAINNYVLNPGKDGIKINTLLSETSGGNTIECNTIVGKAGVYKNDGGDYIVALGNNNRIINNSIDIITISPLVSQNVGIVMSGLNNSIIGNNINGSIANSIGISILKSSLITKNKGHIIDNNIIDVLKTCVSIVDTTDILVSDNKLISDGIVILLSSVIVGDNLYPIHGVVIGNILQGRGSGYLIFSDGSDRISLIGNVFKGDRRGDLSSRNAGGAIIGHGNVSDKSINDIAYVASISSNRGVQYKTNPTKGTFYEGEVISGLTDGVRCTKSGTAGIIQTCTASTTSGDTNIIISATDAVREGYVINIVGLTGDYVVNSVNGTNAVVFPAPDATVSNAAVSFSNPVWSARSEFYV